MAALLTDVEADTTGDAVAFTAPTTVFLDGTQGGASIVLQARIADKEWVFIHEFGFSPVNVNIEGGYQLRAIVAGATSTTNISINATE